ncbi:hypothetical protein LZ30DRAFT_649929 [Colletotrichum cereale]|nr:hypothetical protein LZ30DRAFT_649929 [Colletotrichum cereale]
MRSFLLLLLAPVAVLSFDFDQFATPATGEICCDAGIADPSGTCKGMNLNAYGCINLENDGDAEPGAFTGKGGCDRSPTTFPTGRNVKAFVPVEVRKSLGGNDTAVGFIGCAE